MSRKSEQLRRRERMEILAHPAHGLLFDEQEIKGLF